MPERQRLDRAASAPDLDRLARGDLMAPQDRRVVAARRRVEAIGEARAEQLAGGRVEIDVDAATPVERHQAQIVDAVHVIGMVVGVEHAIDPTDAGVEQLLAEVGRGVDQDRGVAARAVAFDQQRAAPAPILRVGGIARAPMIADPRHAAGRAAAENGEPASVMRRFAARSATDAAPS